MQENKETIEILRETIIKIKLQKNEAEQKMEILLVNTTPTPVSAVNGERQQMKIAKRKEILLLKKRNNELTNLANALAINLARKEKSLEEALHVVDAMQIQKQDLCNLEIQSRTSDSENIPQRPRRIKRRSLTEADMLSISHSKIKNIHLNSEFLSGNQNMRMYDSESEMTSITNVRPKKQKKKKKKTGKVRKNSFKRLINKFTK